MEEISWGQRIFGFESPEFFKRYNLQRETNLHNILAGPVSTDIKDLIEYTLAISLAVYGALYPLVLRLGIRPAVWLHRIGIAAPPLYLWPFFLTGSVLEFGWYSFNEAEVAELLIGFALSIMAAHYWLAQRHQISAQAPPRWDQPVSRRLSAAMGGIFLAVAALSATTTYAMYSDPAKRDRIDARLLNGYEKFAKRYSRYDRWDVSADLYLQVHRAEPQRTSILRRLAISYRELGDEEQFLHYTNKALDIALQKYAKKQDKISTNLSLARTYRQLGETDKSRAHGQRAHEIALERAAENPGSAHRAYWLGKTYRHLDNYQAAMEQFEKASRLKPTSSKYRKAYYKMKRVAGQ
jgi:tetratricopeptide (TPR) repeat protein